MDAAVQAWLLSELGNDTDLTDLVMRYNRLGTARSVALEILRERLAALRAQPSTVTVTSVVGVSYTENIKAYERQIAALEAGGHPAPDEAPTVETVVQVGVVHLQARARR